MVHPSRHAVKRSLPGAREEISCAAAGRFRASRGRRRRPLVRDRPRERQGRPQVRRARGPARARRDGRDRPRPGGVRMPSLSCTTRQARACWARSRKSRPRTGDGQRCCCSSSILRRSL